MEHPAKLWVGDTAYWTRSQLAGHLRTLGLRPGDAVMVHVGLRAVGPVLGGPDTLIGALRDAVGPVGTLLCYVNWEQQYEDALDPHGRLPEALKPHIPPFEALRSRASRDHGAFAELFRTTPGAVRSGNPGASVAALGHRAEWFTTDHPLHYGYGTDSPFGRLVAARGKSLLLGAPLDTLSLLHHAEHLARIPHKRVCRMEVPFYADGRTEWRMIEEFNTADPVVDGLPETYFATVVEEFLATGAGQRGRVGDAPAVLVPAAEVVAFGVRWLEQHAPSPR